MKRKKKRCDTDTISILIYMYGEVVSVYTPHSMEDAKNIYYKNSVNPHSYTQLIINGTEFNTAKAEKYFGMYRIQPQILSVRFINAIGKLEQG